MKIGKKRTKNVSARGAARQEPPPNGSPQCLLRAVYDEHLDEEAAGLHPGLPQAGRELV